MLLIRHAESRNNALRREVTTHTIIRPQKPFMIAEHHHTIRSQNLHDSTSGLGSVFDCVSDLCTRRRWCVHSLSIPPQLCVIGLTELSFLVDAQVIAMLGPDASAADIMRELDKRRSEDAELSERGTQQAQARDPFFYPHTRKDLTTGEGRED